MLTREWALARDTTVVVVVHMAKGHQYYSVCSLHRCRHLIAEVVSIVGSQS